MCADWLKLHLEEFVSAVILLFILKPAQIICVGKFGVPRGPGQFSSFYFNKYSAFCLLTSKSCTLTPFNVNGL